MNCKISVDEEYDPNIKLVSKAVESILKRGSASYGAVDYQAAVDACADAVSGYVDKPGNYLSRLVSEGLFNVFEYDGEKFITFSYELVGQFCIADSLVRQAQACACGSASVRAELCRMLQEENSWITYDAGQFAALMVQAFERLDCELSVLAFDCGIEANDIGEAFVESLAWRTLDAITPELEGLLRKSVLNWPYTLKRFIDQLFRICLRRGNALGPRYLEGLLQPLTQASFDCVWSANIAMSHAADAFVEWMRFHADRLSVEHVDKAASMLALVLTSVNAHQRKLSTLALARLLKDRPIVARALFERFGEAHDDYLLEGLHAALYGAAVNSSDLTEWRDVASSALDRVFMPGCTYPNVVVRDFARLLVEHVFASCGDKEMMLRARPPYVSEWYESLPDNNEIDGIVLSVEEEYGEHSGESVCVRRIVHSMTTEYGRGTGGYGDFGRYTLGSHLRLWNNQFDDQLLSNAVTKVILRDWYELPLVVEYDRTVMYDEGRFYPGCERIGKKYQVIGMHRLLARLMDNHLPYRVEKEYADGYEQALNEHASETWLSFMRGESSDAPTKPFDELKWVIGEHRIDLEECELVYEVASLREYDPSFIWGKDDFRQEFTRVDMPGDYEGLTSSIWVSRDSEREGLDALRVRDIEGRRFYVMAVSHYWKERINNKRFREATWLGGVCFVDADAIEGLVERVSSFARGGGPFEEHCHVCFGELYDGYSYAAMNALFEEDCFDSGSQLEYAVYDYNCADALDEVMRVSLFVPSKNLTEYFGLESKQPGAWLDREGQLLAVASIDLESKSSVLLFDADSIDAYSAFLGKKVVWDEYFEKETRSDLYRCWQTVVKTASGFESHVSDQGCYEKDMALLREYAKEWVE